MLSNADIAELTEIRHALHRQPELSGAEAQTARSIAGHLEAHGPEKVITGLGGHGVAAVFRGAAPGPRLMFRCELDALPIEETPRAYRSTNAGVAHLCGHDGHMAIMLGLARMLERTPPARGEVVLMFQPAEETGVGAPGVVADPRYEDFAPDFAYALHNMPGLPLGHVGLAAGPVASASRGMQVTLTGHESHSAYPDAARAPTESIAGLMTALPELGTRDIPEFRRVTVTHVSLGQPNFGITPGHGTLFATLRTHTNGDMASLVGEAETLVGTAAMGAGLTLDISYHDVFEHLENAPQAVAHLEQALTACGIPFGPEGGAMIPSEDFAAFSHRAPAAMLFLGAGPAHPALHRPDYDFPDDLIPIGAHLFDRVVRDRLG